METLDIPNQQTLYYVELIPAKSSEYVAPEALRIIRRINNIHKCKAVYRLHADRARELTGEKARDTFEALGITVTSTANYDSNANGRVERAVLFFQERVRTLLSTTIRSEKLQDQLKKLWTFAAQHVGEVHIRSLCGMPPCKYEFGQRILARVHKTRIKAGTPIACSSVFGVCTECYEWILCYKK